jgi:outer membrane biosynthesis protein TonB
MAKPPPRRAPVPHRPKHEPEPAEPTVEPQPAPPPAAEPAQLPEEAPPPAEKTAPARPPVHHAPMNEERLRFLLRHLPTLRIDAARSDDMRALISEGYVYVTEEHIHLTDKGLAALS